MKHPYEITISSIPFCFLFGFFRQGLALDEGPANCVQLAGLAEEVASDAGCGEKFDGEWLATWETLGKFTMKCINRY